MATGQHSVTAHKLSAEQANSVRSALKSLISSDTFAPSKHCQDFHNFPLIEEIRVGVAAPYLCGENRKGEVCVLEREVAGEFAFQGCEV
jgi:hypothetical protein